MVQKRFEKIAAETPHDEQLSWGVFGHLALSEHHLGHPEKAKELCLRSLEFFEKYGTRGYLGVLKYRLALAEEALGENDLALLHVKEALDWFDRLGMKPDYAEALPLLVRLES
jgi:tetratricopeptide (TPR) repeat protein